MNTSIKIYNSLSSTVSHMAGGAVPLLARLTFAAVLLHYFIASGLTKLGDGLFGFLSPSVGAYAQIFPKAMEDVTYGISQLTVFHWAVVTGGTIAEFALPALIVLGLLTRLAALGMIGFVVVQSLTDLFRPRWHRARRDARRMV